MLIGPEDVRQRESEQRALCNDGSVLRGRAEKQKSAAPVPEAFLTTETDKAGSVERFVTKVKSITRPAELTPELVHTFIEKLVVSEARYVDGRRV